MKAAIYCRLSKEDEYKVGESESIQNQKSMLIQYAVENGFEIYQIYSDEDYSGIDRNRPAFNAMIQAAGEHRFDLVLASAAPPRLEELAPGLVVTWGGHVVSKRLKQWLRRVPSLTHWHVSEAGEPVDVFGRLTAV